MPPHSRRLLCQTLALTLLLTLSAFAATPQSIILDDDCSNDVDCVLTLPILFELQHRGDLHVLALMADSANPQSAPVLHLFAQRAGYPDTPIGANQTAAPDTALSRKEGANASKWTAPLIARFAPGDTRANYPDCATLYRRILAHAPAHSVAIAATGFATCLNQLLATPPDALSPLTGRALVQQKVSILSIMGGEYPSGKEWNFLSDARGWRALLTLWTSPHGFPHIYLNGFSNGLHIIATPPPAADPQADPTHVALEAAHTTSRPMWDILSVLATLPYATDDTPLTFTLRPPGPTQYFTRSTPGTVHLNPKTGIDTWTPTPDSGHSILRIASSTEALRTYLNALITASK